MSIAIAAINNTSIANLIRNPIEKITKVFDLDKVDLNKQSSQMPEIFNSLVARKQNAFALLTDREIEVIYCLVAGKCAKLTARELRISSRTVERHFENIKMKLGCRNKFQLIEALFQFKRS